MRIHFAATIHFALLIERGLCVTVESLRCTCRLDCTLLRIIHMGVSDSLHAELSRIEDVEECFATIDVQQGDILLGIVAVWMRKYLVLALAKHVAYEAALRKCFTVRGPARAAQIQQATSYLGDSILLTQEFWRLVRQAHPELPSRAQLRIRKGWHLIQQMEKRAEVSLISSDLGTRMIRSAMGQLSRRGKTVH